MLMAVMMIRVSELRGIVIRGKEVHKFNNFAHVTQVSFPLANPCILQLRSFEAVPDPNTSTMTGAPAPCRL